jgi:uncharacterized integral membrane protein
MKSVKAVLWALLTVLLLLFLFQNRDPLLSQTTLELNLFGPLQFRSTPIPLYALILGSLFLGAVIAALYCGLGNFRLHKTVRSLRRQNNGLQTELKSLRNLPITEADVPTSPPAEASESEPTGETKKADSK